ncbi:SAF domain-containing protein [Sanguibacter suaedae]|uniref:SAF domain-containing protein n=1 Tax=Sanguibacter suaedae TaxID=2795737 RepID=A0A934M9G6_9MICO|nr:SAF domain-containing protein [Sanguibacter suaedae]MBI9114643.1 hypothetical protein [Sanguibacter suaedae]
MSSLALPLVPTGPLPPLRGPRVRRRWRSAVWRSRFLMAALLWGTAAAAAVAALRPPAADLHDVLVVDRELTAGSVVRPSDVRTVRVPVDLVADDALSMADLTGPDSAAAPGAGSTLSWTLAVDVAPGTVLGSSLLVPPDLVAPPGRVIAAVRLADPALVGMLTPGTRVDLLAPPEPASDLVALSPDPVPVPGDGAGHATPAVHLARGALVVPTPSAPSPESTGGLDLGGDTAVPETILLVAVTAEEASYLAAAVGKGALSAVVVG